MQASSEKIEKLLLLILMVVMPFHIIIFKVISNQLLVLWRDGLILILFFLCFGKVKIKKTDLMIGMGYFACIIYAFLTHSEDQSAAIWINVIRVYMLPNILFLVTRQIKVDNKYIKKIIRCFITGAVFASVFGIIQMFFFSKTYRSFMRLGYASVLLSNGFQRNIGFTDSANAMGLYVLFSLILLIECKDLFRNIVVKSVFIIIECISIFLTFSISVCIALLFYIVYKGIYNKKWTRMRFMTFGCVASAMIFILGFLFFSNIPFCISIKEQILQRMDEILFVLSDCRNISNSNSASIHLNGLKKGLELVTKNIWGLGFAKESFMVAGKVAYSIKGNQESSYFTIFYDFGFFLGLIYLFPFFYSIFALGKNQRDAYCRAAQMIMCCLLICFLSLPLIQVYELRFYAFLFCGIVMSQTVYKKQQKVKIE